MMSENERLQEKIDKLVEELGPVRVLEAGCGARAHVNFGSLQEISGIDISKQQLERNDYLKDKILGDIQTFNLSGREYDFIVSWDVLEHLPRPKMAIRNMHSGIRKGGYLVLAMPNLYSLKGLVTKFTPYMFHVWFYKYIIGDKRNVEETDQFPTFLRRAISPRALCRFARHNSMEIVHLKLYEGPVQKRLRQKSKIANLGFTALGFLSRILSFGSLNLNHSDYMIILKKTCR